MSDRPLADRVAFGFRVHGVAERSLTAADRPDWPPLHVSRSVGDAGEAAAHLGPDEARLSLGDGGWLELDRAARTARYLTTTPVDEDTLIHPWLAPAAALTARWLGREAFHAGAFLSGDGAWAVVGTNQAGKSTLLADMAAGGTPVMTDDTLVVDRSCTAYAGPRCIDLRDPVPLGSGTQRLRAVRRDSRMRMDLPATIAAAPLRGWIFLEWGARVEAVRIPAADRLGQIIAQRRWAIEPIDPHMLLDLAGLPAWTLQRPRGAAHMRSVSELVRDLASARPAAGTHPDRDLSVWRA